MTTKADAARRDAGFTLVELMMAIVVMGIVMGPLTAALVVGLRTTDETSTRLAGSNDAQLVSLWLPPDLQSTGNQNGDVVATPTTNTDCSGVANVLRLQWRAAETAGGPSTSYTAAYAIVQSATADWRLVRYSCVGGGTATTHVVARKLVSSSAATVTTSGTKVSMTLTEAATATAPSGYTFTVSGYRRTP